MELRARQIIPLDIEGHYAFFPVVEGLSTREHRHDFYEVFLIASGSLVHHINGDDEHLPRHSLVFIRPDDAHYFSQYANDECELINLAFLTETFHALSAYLGFEEEYLLQPSQPPTAHLSLSEGKQVEARLRTWGRLLYRDPAQSRQALRALLAQLISQHFTNPQPTVADSTPQWLLDLTQTMRQPEHFMEGRVALMRLANRTPEYVGRSFQQYLGLTPSQFINELRLDYASDQLLHSNLSPTDICYDAGFGNLSYFYQLFKERWGCSPNQFRQQHQQTLNP